ncbi:replication initiator protein [Microvirus mar40]|uniref:Replication initiator protein n=1 Tax=Microvirus mar40 TaxID=2851175 RepID=A0A8F5XTB7_9VIRU|nr:replication initiator protein [Microvirus mar40]
MNNMCLYPITIKNKRFLPNKKNGGNPPKCTDHRLLYVDCDCGYCYECRKKNARQWRIRMCEELKTNPHAIFFTGTFTDERIEKLSKKYKIEKDDYNGIATKEMRLFLERLRSKNGGKSIKHWVVTERGHTNTRRIHIHGIFFHEDKQFLLKLLKECWIAGYKYNGKYVNEKTINYIVKYLTKTDLDNPEFKGKILCSAGLGKNYIKSRAGKQTKYIPKTETAQTRDWYIFKNGEKACLPRYYREKLFTEDERQLLWIEKQEEGYSYVMGEKIETKDDLQIMEYKKLKRYYRDYCIRVHKDNPDDWEKKRNKNRMLRQLRKQQIQEEKQKKWEDAIRLKSSIHKNKAKFKLFEEQQAREKLDEDINIYKHLYESNPFKMFSSEGIESYT